MAHFYGRVQGQAGEASRLGNKRSGICSTVQTWGMTLRADLDHNATAGSYPVPAELLDEKGGMDILSIRFQPHYAVSRPILTLRNPDLVAKNSDDPKVAALFDKMHALGHKIEQEAIRAQKRKVRERKRREREQKRGAA